jgi:GTP-binding protein Era
MLNSLSAFRVSINPSLWFVLPRRFLRNKPPLRTKTQGSEKRLDIVILGTPNVGKSALLNRLIGTHVAAATRKAHTTRRQILGVLNYKSTQLVFFDTPGYIAEMEAKSKEKNQLRLQTKSAAESTDIVMIVIDAARRLTEKYDVEFCEMAKMAYAGAKQEVILILNKVDLVEPKDRLLDVVEKYVSLMNGVKYGPEGRHLAQLDVTTFMISALKDDGVIDIKNYLLASSSYKSWILPKERGSTNMSDGEIVQEIVYEKLLENVHDEIPHSALVQCTSISEINPTRLMVNVTISVENDRQKRIVIGQQGRSMLKIRQAACKLLEAILHKDIILEFDIQTKSKSTDAAQYSRDDSENVGFDEDDFNDKDSANKEFLVSSMSPPQVG